MEEVKKEGSNRREQRAKVEVLPPFLEKYELIRQDTFGVIATANEALIDYTLKNMSPNKTWESVCPLHIAAAYGAKNWVVALLEKRANTECIMTSHHQDWQQGATPLDLACAYGNWECAIPLLAHFAKPINIRRIDANSQTALHWIFSDVNLDWFNNQQPSPSMRLRHQVYIAASDSLVYGEKEYQSGITLLATLFGTEDFTQQSTILAKHFNRPTETLFGKTILAQIRERCFDKMLLIRINADEQLHWALGIKHSSSYYDLDTPIGRCLLRHNIMQSHLTLEDILPLQQWKVDASAVTKNVLLTHNTDALPEFDPEVDSYSN